MPQIIPESPVKHARYSRNSRTEIRDFLTDSTQKLRLDISRLPTAEAAVVSAAASALFKSRALLQELSTQPPRDHAQLLERVCAAKSELTRCRRELSLFEKMPRASRRCERAARLARQLRSFERAIYRRLREKCPECFARKVNQSKTPRRVLDESVLKRVGVSPPAESSTGGCVPSLDHSNHGARTVRTVSDTLWTRLCVSVGIVLSAAIGILGSLSCGKKQGREKEIAAATNSNVVPGESSLPRVPARTEDGSSEVTQRSQLRNTNEANAASHTTTVVAPGASETLRAQASSRLAIPEGVSTNASSRPFIPPIIASRLEDPTTPPFERLFLNGLKDQFASNGSQEGESYYVGAYHPGCFDELHEIPRTIYTIVDANAVNEKLSAMPKAEFHALWGDRTKRDEGIARIHKELRSNPGVESPSPVGPKQQGGSHRPQPPQERGGAGGAQNSTPERMPAGAASPTSPQARQGSSIFDRRIGEISRFVDEHNRSAAHDTYLLFIPPPQGQSHTHAPLELSRRDYTLGQVQELATRLQELPPTDQEVLFHNPERLDALLAQAIEPRGVSSDGPNIEASSGGAEPPVLPSAQDMHAERVLFSSHSHLSDIGGAVELTAPHQEFFRHVGLTLHLAERHEEYIVGRFDSEFQNESAVARLRSELSHEGDVSARAHVITTPQDSTFGGDFGLAVEKQRDEHHADFGEHIEHEAEESEGRALFQLSAGLAKLGDSFTVSAGALYRENSPGGYAEIGHRWKGGLHHLSAGGYATVSDYGAHIAYAKVSPTDELQLSYNLESGRHRLAGEYTVSLGDFSLQFGSQYRTSSQHGPHFNGRLDEPFFNGEEYPLVFSVAPWYRISRNFVLTSKLDCTLEDDISYRVGILFRSNKNPRFAIHGEVGRDEMGDERSYFAGKLAAVVRW